MANLKRRLFSVRWLFVLGLAIRCVTSSAAPLDGEWKFTWSCEGATGMYAEECAQGARDYFLLELWTEKDAVCGFHTATAPLGNRVDEGDLLDGNPTITGTVDGTSAKVTFRSAWGATGSATLQVEGDKLQWKILTQSEGMSWVPKMATLDKQSPSIKAAVRKCQLPAEHQVKPSRSIMRKGTDKP
jgi:hypothetical protein